MGCMFDILAVEKNMIRVLGTGTSRLPAPVWPWYSSRFEEPIQVANIKHHSIPCRDDRIMIGIGNAMKHVSRRGWNPERPQSLRGSSTLDVSPFSSPVFPYLIRDCPRLVHVGWWDMGYCWAQWYPVLLDGPYPFLDCKLSILVSQVMLFVDVSIREVENKSVSLSSQVP